MGLSVSLIWRGPLATCNYSCHYCPFAKRRESATQRDADERALERFVNWVSRRPADDRLSILFMPWGEALTRRRYRDALATLSHLEQVQRVAIQTNLACAPDWLAPIDPTRLALWATWHPSQTPLDGFIKRVQILASRHIRLSVGMVGIMDAVDDAERLRQRLPGDIYLWINAHQGVRGYYDSPAGREAAARFRNIDPLFDFTLTPQRSFARACGAGQTVVSVDGDGVIRRCHFISKAIGQLYEPGSLEEALKPRPCTRAACRCFTGFAHLPHLGLDTTFGDGLLERVPPMPLALPSS